MAPLWRPGYLLYRDAVSTPRTFFTDTTLGIGGNPPRAVPQDGFIAAMSTVVDGGVVVVVIMTLSLLAAGVGYGLLARRVVPAAGIAGASMASIVGVWNPFVAERLLQGHWSLLTAYASLGWILLSALHLRHDDDSDSDRRWWPAAYLAVLSAALTPSGWLISSTTLVVALTVPSGVARRWRTCAASLVPIVVGMLPWLTAVAVGSSDTSVHGVSVSTFALRAEPGLGRVLTSMSLGGIWNSDAVPASRQTPWAAIAALLFILVAAVGIWQLWRTRRALDAGARAAVRSAALLGAGALIVVLAASFGPGAAVLTWLVSNIGGAGLLRDATKFLMLAVPLVAMAAAEFIEALRRWVPAGFAVAVTLILVVAPLPDLAWGVGGRIVPITYPDEWITVTQQIPADEGAVALWPGDTVRRFDFTRGPSLDPTARMVRAAVAESGALTVDGVTVDEKSRWADDIHRALSRGGDVSALGVGWVLASQPVPGFDRIEPVFVGPTLTLYRIANPRTDIGPSNGARTAALAALWLWMASTAVAAIAAVGMWWRCAVRR